MQPNQIQDICVGNVLQPGAGATTSRMAALHAGFPEEVSVHAVNRQCSSGLQAVAIIAASIKAGYIDVGIGAGVESMTHYYGPAAVPSNLSENVLKNKSSANCLLPMGITSENVAERFQISKQKQDFFAIQSHQKAAKARSSGLFKKEIVPVTIIKEGKIVAEIAEDDGIRSDVNEKMLAGLKPSFKENGTTTAGNASQVSDGAAAIVLVRRGWLKDKKDINGNQFVPLARFAAFSVVGCPPDIMGIGPALAIPAVIKQFNGIAKTIEDNNILTLKDIDVIELNEAFASQAVYCIEKLNLQTDKVNPLGGAIALGHPLGATGARQIATLIAELKRRKGRYGIVSMCIGTGMGAAAIIENEF